MKLHLSISHVFNGYETKLLNSLTDFRRATNEDIKDAYISFENGKIIKNIGIIYENTKESDKITTDICIKEFMNKQIVSKHGIDNNWAGEHLVLYKDNTFEYAVHGSGRIFIKIYTGTYNFL